MCVCVCVYTHTCFGDLSWVLFFLRNKQIVNVAICIIKIFVIS